MKGSTERAAQPDSIVEIPCSRTYEEPESQEQLARIIQSSITRRVAPSERTHEEVASLALGGSPSEVVIIETPKSEPEEWINLLRKTLATAEPSPSAVAFRIIDTSKSEPDEWINLFRKNLAMAEPSPSAVPFRIIEASKSEPEEWISLFRKNLAMAEPSPVEAAFRIIGRELPTYRPTPIPLFAGDSRERQRDLLMESTLNSLPQRQGVSAEASRSALAFWKRLRTWIPTVTLPQTQVTPEGGIHMAWQRGGRFASIDVSGNAAVDWFFQDPGTGEAASGDDQESPLGFISYLQKLFEQR